MENDINEAAPADILLNKINEENANLPMLLAESIKFVRLQLSGMVGNRSIPSAKVVVEGDKTVDRKDVTCPTLRIISKEWRSKFNAVYNKAQKLLATAAPKPCEATEENIAIPGCWIVLAKELPRLQNQILQLRITEFQPLVKEFAKEYPTLIDNCRKLVSNADWVRMSRFLPNATSLETAITLTLKEIPITFIGEVGRDYADNVAKAVVGSLSDELQEEVENIISRIGQSNSRYKHNSFNKLKEIFAKLKDFSFLASPEVLKKLQAAETAVAGLGLDPHLMLNADLKTNTQTVVNGLKTILEDLSDQANKDKKGIRSNRRRIEV